MHSQPNSHSTALNSTFLKNNIDGSYREMLQRGLSYYFWHHIHLGVFLSRPTPLFRTFSINFPFGSGSRLCWIFRIVAISEEIISNDVALFLCTIGRRESGAQICLLFYSFEFTEYVKINSTVQTKISCGESAYMFNKNSAP